jgi:hypothetical protein
MSNLIKSQQKEMKDAKESQKKCEGSWKEWKKYRIWSKINTGGPKTWKEM